MIINLESLKWKEFRIGDIFIVSGTKTTPPESLISNGNIPRITCAGTNNALDTFYKNESTEKGGVLTVDSATEGFIYYQGYDFIATDHVEIIRLKEDKFMSKGLGLFLVNSINNFKDGKYYYGYKFSQKRIKNQIIKLPVDKYGNPDWEYMEYLGNEVINKEEKYIIEYINEKINTLKNVLIDSTELNLEDKKWEVYNLEELFTIRRGKRLTKKNQKEGYIPYISSTGMNNGVNNFISNNKNVRSFENVSTIANSGTVGSTFYHNYKFVASDHVTALINDNFNKYHYLFINTLLKVMGKKYHFNREMNDFRLSREKIMLPIDENNNIDLYFMEKYMQQVELNKLIKLRDYLLLKK